MFRILQYLMVIGAMLIVAGCSSGPDPDATSIPDSIEVIYQTGPSIKPAEKLMLVIRNRSESCLAFSYDFDSSMYTLIDNKRVDFSNEFRYLEGGEKILFQFGKQKEVVDSLFVNAVPDVSKSNLTGPTEFILIIQGHLCDDPEATFQKEIPFTVVP